MFTTSLTTWVSVCSLVMLLLGGCSSKTGPGRVIVSGMVTYKDKPVPKAQVRFSPKPGSKSPLVIVEVKDGHYDTSSVGGVPIGEHRVEIRAYDPNAPIQTDPLEPPPQQLLPERYNERSELQAVFEPGETTKVLDFKLN